MNENENENKFYFDLKRGLKGEKKIEKLFSNCKFLDFISTIIDFDKKYDEYNFKNVTADINYQKKDIDFILESNSKEISFELKTDFHDSENFFAEIISSVYKNNLGCWFKTQSDYILYYFIDSNKLYILNTEICKCYTINNLNDLKHIYIDDNQTVGVLININDLMDYINKNNTKGGIWNEFDECI